MSRLQHLSLIFLFVLPFVVAAQTPDTATIHGQVIDQTLAGIAGVQVTARNTQIGLERTAGTDDTGHFSLAGLPIAGTYDISAKKIDFAEALLKGLTLAGGTTADINLD